MEFHCSYGIMQHEGEGLGSRFHSARLKPETVSSLEFRVEDCCFRA